MAEDRADLADLGFPVWVPEDSWSSGGIESTDGEPDGVLVLGAGVEVRTERRSRPAPPVSVRVRNLQAAEVNAPNSQHLYDGVVVEEVDLSITVDGVSRPVRGLATTNRAAVLLELDEVRIIVSGEVELVASIRLRRA